MINQLPRIEALPYSRMQQFNTSKSRQNGPHFPDDIFKCTFLNEDVYGSITISPNFVPNGPINSIPA